MLLWQCTGTCSKVRALYLVGLAYTTTLELHYDGTVYKITPMDIHAFEASFFTKWNWPFSGYTQIVSTTKNQPTFMLTLSHPTVQQCPTHVPIAPLYDAARSRMQAAAQTIYSHCCLPLCHCNPPSHRLSFCSHCSRLHQRDSCVVGAGPSWSRQLRCQSMASNIVSWQSWGHA